MNDFRPTRGSAREIVSDQELERARGSIVADERRRRSLYFDGRFLAARDLTRDQAYFLTRQADLGRALGAGVVSGLRVSTNDTGNQLLLTPGHGLTASGELVVIRDTGQPGDAPAPIVIDLADAPTIERLDAAFGLSRTPRSATRKRTGTFILALRPVEFTANPIAQYPTSLSDRKSEPLRDGDIVEAAALALIPFDTGPESSQADARARAARAVFFASSAVRLPVDALPVAMLGLSRGVVEWVDEWLVRRELADEPYGFGVAPRSVRTAFVRQHLDHLSDTVERRTRAGQSPTFSATEHFLALPPVGRVPPGVVALRAGALEQTFFPPELDVELSLVPRDELPVLLEDAASLPPLDLTLEGETFESVQVSILIPVDRGRLAALKRELTELRLRVSADPSARLLRQRPLLALRALTRLRAEAPAVADNLVLEAWRGQLEGAKGDVLWYVRRRSSPAASAVVPRERAATSELVDLGMSFARTAQEDELMRSILERASEEVRLSMLRFLLERHASFVQPLLLSGFLAEVPVPPVLPAPLLNRYNRPNSGAGIARVVAADARLNQVETRRFIARARAVPELDQRAADTSTDPSELAQSVLALVAQGDPRKLLEALQSNTIITR